MIRSTLRSAALVALVSGAMIAPAIAERVSTPVTITFDEAALTERADAQTVLSSLERQARDACTTVTPITRVELVDQTCVADVVDQAVKAINSPVLNSVYADATGSAVKVASLD
ncbi:MAG: UrcA family protein [Pseudomonadota bacterium]